MSFEEYLFKKSGVALPPGVNQEHEVLQEGFRLVTTKNPTKAIEKRILEAAKDFYGVFYYRVIVTQMGFELKDMEGKLLFVGTVTPGPRGVWVKVTAPACSRGWC